MGGTPTFPHRIHHSECSTLLSGYCTGHRAVQSPTLTTQQLLRGQQKIFTSVLFAHFVAEAFMSIEPLCAGARPVRREYTSGCITTIKSHYVQYICTRQAQHCNTGDQFNWSILDQAWFLQADVVVVDSLNCLRLTRCQLAHWPPALYL